MADVMECAVAWFTGGKTLEMSAMRISYPFVPYAVDGKRDGAHVRVSRHCWMPRSQDEPYK